ncbi:MAG: SPOR domain-containing protein [Kordiimonadaceae bacterium]|nr:SPOR domain-containing protein [Kordiimonadaceae bacterium]
MHALNKSSELPFFETSGAKLGRAVTASALLLLLGACSGGFGLFSSNNSTGSVGGTFRMQSNVRNAVCEGRADEAVAIMSAEPLASQPDKFFVALAIDESGHPVRARQLYVRLMQVGSQERVLVNCGNRVLADGTVANEAARRLAAVAQQMAALDANLRPTPALHSGLPALTPRRNSAASSSSGSPFVASGSPVMIQRPSSQSPFGRWFVHLSSYRSLENAEGNRATLERKFPKLSGLIDQWQVNVNGPAIRLGVRTDNKPEATAICNAIKSQGSYCAVLDSSK